MKGMANYTHYQGPDRERLRRLAFESPGRISERARATPATPDMLGGTWMPHHF